MKIDGVRSMSILEDNTCIYTLNMAVLKAELSAKSRTDLLEFIKGIILEMDDVYKSFAEITQLLPGTNSHENLSDYITQLRRYKDKIESLKKDQDDNLSKVRNYKKLIITKNSTDVDSDTNILLNRSDAVLKQDSKLEKLHNDVHRLIADCIYKYSKYLPN